MTSLAMIYLGVAAVTLIITVIRAYILVAQYRKERKLRAKEEDTKLEKLLLNIKSSKIKNEIEKWCQTEKEA